MSTTAVCPLEPLADAEPQRFGRVETYVHSDSITRNKGASMVTVICESEAGARTVEFIAFVRIVAKYAYAASATCWADIVTAFPDMDARLNALQSVLHETVFLVNVKVMTV